MRAVITRHYKTLINASEQILGWRDSPRDKSWRADVAFVGAQLRERGVSFDAHKVKKRISLARLTEVLRYQFEVFNTRPSRNQYANRASTLRTPNAASTSTFPDISQNQ